MRALALAVAALLVACAPADAQQGSRSEAQREKEELLWARPDDAAVEAAKAEARKTLPVFWTHLSAADPADSNFLIKVGLPVKDGGAEHIWGSVVKRDGDDLVVRLANEPFYLPGLHLGSEVRTSISRVSDWSYDHGGRKYGHFTTRVLMRTATPEQREQLAAILAPTPLEAEAK